MAQDIGTLQEKNESRAAIAGAILGERVEHATNAQGQAIMVLQDAYDADSPLSEIFVKPVSSSEFEEAMQKSIGWEWKVVPDGDGKMVMKKEKIKDAKDRDRTDDARAAFDLAQGFLKKGFVEMDREGSPDLERFQEIAIKTIEKAYFEGREILEELYGDHVPPEAMNEILSSPLFAEKLKEALEEAVKFGNVENEIEPDVARRKEDAELELKRLEDKLETLNARHETTEELYIPGTIKPLVDAGANMDDEAQSIIVQMERLQEEIAQFESAARKARERANTYKKDAEADDKRTALDQAGTADDRALEKTRELRALKIKQADIERYRRNLTSTGKTEHESEDKINELKDQIRTAQVKLARINAEYDQEVIKVQEHERAFISKLAGAPESAVRAYLTEMTRKLESARNELIKENGDDQLSAGLQNRWNFRGQGDGKAGERNEIAIRQDYKDLIANGPEQVVIRTLMAGGMRYEEAVAKMEDKAFAKKATQEVVERLLTRQVQSGKITEAELGRIIDNKDWGGADLVERALANRLNYVESSKRDALKAAGVLQEGFKEKLMAMPKNKLVKLLLLILVLGVVSLDLLGGFGLVSGAAKAGVGLGKAVWAGGSEVVHGAADMVGVGHEHVVNASADTQGWVTGPGGQAIAGGAVNLPGDIATGATSGTTGGAIDAVTSTVSSNGSTLGKDIATGVLVNAPKVEDIFLGAKDHGGDFVRGLNNMDNADKIANTVAVVGGAAGLKKVFGKKEKH